MRAPSGRLLSLMQLETGTQLAVNGGIKVRPLAHDSHVSSTIQGYLLLGTAERIPGVPTSRKSKSP